MRPYLSKEDFEEIFHSSAFLNANILVMDGENESGKTLLSSHLYEEGRITEKTIHLDKYLEKKDGGFLERLDLKKIAENIKENRGKFGNILVQMEGIMALNVLDEVKRGYSLNRLNPCILYICSEEWIQKWIEYGNKSLHDIFQIEEKRMFVVNTRLDLMKEIEMEPHGIIHAQEVEDIQSLAMPMDRFNFDLFAYTSMRQPWKFADFILVKNTDISDDAPYLRIWR